MKSLRIVCVLIAVLPLSAQTNTFIPWGGVNQQSTNYTATALDIGKTIVMNCSPCTLTLPAASPYNQWTIQVENINSGPLTVSPNGLNLDGSSSSLTLTQNQGVYITSDGTNYFTQRGIGGGVAPVGGLDTPLTTVAFSATPVFDLTATNVFLITLTGNVTSSTLINPPAAGLTRNTATFIVIQDSTGGRSFSWPANTSGGILIDSTALANAHTSQSFIWNGTKWDATGPGSTTP